MGVYGVRGWLKIESYTQPRDNIFGYTPWWLETSDGWRETEVVAGRPQGKGLVVQLNGVEDRDQAAALMDTNIAIERGQLPELPKREYYWADLKGLEVVTQDGVSLGRVENLLETGANDVLIVRGERERLVPYIPEQVVTRIDLQAGRIEVDWDADF